MELALAESSVYFPPIFLGVLLFVYRNSILPLSSIKVIPIVSNQLVFRKNQLIEVIHYGSQMVYKLQNTLQIAISTLLQGPLLVYQHIIRIFATIRLQFDVVSIQVSNLTQSAFRNVSSFFQRSPKTSWDTFTLSCIVLGGISVTLLAYWYLQKVSMSPHLSVPPVTDEPVVEKKAVRRKRKVN